MLEAAREWGRAQNQVGSTAHYVLLRASTGVALIKALDALDVSRQSKPRYFVQDRGVDGYAVLMRWGDGTGPFFALCHVRADAETMCELLNLAES